MTTKATPAHASEGWNAQQLAGRRDDLSYVRYRADRDKTDIVTKLSLRSVADRLASHRAGGQQGNDAVRRDGSERRSTPSRTSAARHHAGDLRQPGPGNTGSGFARAEGRGAETKTRNEESCIT